MIGFIRTALLYATLGLAIAITLVRVIEESIGIWVMAQCSRPGAT